MRRGRYGESGGGLGRSPIVGALAAVVIIVAAVLVVRQWRRQKSRGSDSPVVGDAVTMICRDCGEVFKLSRTDLELREGADIDAFQDRATGKPCPKCKSKNTVVAVSCPHCKKPFAPPTEAAAIRDFKCPHCGKSPWKR